MFIEVPEKVAQKTVVKRDGKKVEFDGAKIALAIQQGFGERNAYVGGQSEKQTLIKYIVKFFQE